MPSFSVTVPHSVGKQAARDRVANFLDNVRQDFSGQVSEVGGDWSGDELKFRLVASGLAISGSLLVGDTAVEVMGSLPLAAMFFKGQIESRIRDDLKRLLD